MTQRTDRIDELLRQEIGDIIARHVADPRVGFATITRVETAPDLGHAKVWVSVIGQPDEREETVRALGRAMPFVRHQLGNRIRLRRIPELHLRLDETADRGTRILKLLSELDEGHTPEAEGPLGESLPTPVRRLPAEGETPEEPDTSAASPPAKPTGPFRDRAGRRDPRREPPAGRRGARRARGKGTT